MNRSCVFNGEYGTRYDLVATDDLFVVRTKGENAVKLLFEIEALGRWQQFILPYDAFPESFVYLFKCSNVKDVSAFRDEIKAVIRNARLPEIEYIGTVRRFAGSGGYQIYTGNLFIKLLDSVPQSAVYSFFRNAKIQVKLELGYAPNAYFVAPQEDLGGDIFDFSQELLANGLVEYCHPELVVKNRSVSGIGEVLMNSSDPLPAIDWILQKTNVYDAWKITRGRNTKICIIDDGLEINHPAFRRKGKVVAPIDMMQFKEGGFPHHQYNERHGTACASIACSEDPVALGVAPEAQLMPVRITGLGSVYQSYAIYWAVKNGADVISCSWGPPDGQGASDPDFVFPIPDHTNIAFNYAADKGRNGKGCAIVFAAGNGKELVKSDGYASHPKVFAIGASNFEDHATAYSDYGYPMLCCFPSGDYMRLPDNHLKKLYGVYVADRLGVSGYDDTDYFRFFNGTSASCPGVAGIISLMISANDQLTRDEIRLLIQKSCKKIGSPPDYVHDYSENYGYGLIMADEAVQNAIKTSKSISSMEKKLNLKKAISLHIGINVVDNAYYKGLVPELAGCVNDMEKMKMMASEMGYDTYTLENDQAKKEVILEKISSLASQLQPGGILLITYAGHGAPVPGTMDDDEEKDQTWVTYNGFLLDDEINACFASIEVDPTQPIRIVVVSDSCHSRTVTRFFNPAQKVRGLDINTFENVLKANNETVDLIRARGRSEQGSTPKAYIKNLSACKDDQQAKEINGEGVFTKAILSVYNQVIKRGQKISYADFIRRVTEIISDSSQIPGVENTGAIAVEFDNQFPFQIDHYLSITEKELPIISKIKQKEKQLLILGKDKDLISMPGRGLRGAAVNTRKITDLAISSEGIDGSTEWDKAYEVYLANLSEDVPYIEPDMASNVYPTSAENEIEVRSASPSSYIPTYPFPEANYSQPFTWHLDHRHSQLEEANELVFPEIVFDRTPDNTDQLVKIAHIDTGILPRHPARPLFLEPGAVTFTDDVTYEGAFDYDIPIPENQGHGNATLAILAGGKVSMQETQGKFQGYFGAIPFAKVLSLKISDNVLLLSGRNFAAAVDYAIKQKCEVITISMGGLPSRIMAEAVNRAYEAGIVIVAAAGNCFAKGVGKWVTPVQTVYPARFDRVITAVGATFNDTPYLYEINQLKTRGFDEKYMQMSYGPSEVLKTTLAGYTPNVPWFNRKDGEAGTNPVYFGLAGAGTSCATPQVAAAAALYIQKYRNELNGLAGRQKWKKVEMVREALFQSGKKDPQYASYFGNGILRAADALNEQFKPANMIEAVTSKYGTNGAQKAVEARGFFSRFFGLFRSRSLADTNNYKGLQEMLNMEIVQLLYRDENLHKYLDRIDLESESVVNESNMASLVNDIRSSSKASSFLKNALINSTSHFQVTRGLGEQNNCTRLYSDWGIIEIKTRGIPVEISKLGVTSNYSGQDEIFVDEFEVRPLQDHSLRSTDGGLTIAENFEEHKSGMETALLLEIHDEEGVYYEWQFKNEKDGVNSRGLTDDLDPNQYTISISATRGKGKIFKWIGKLFSWKKANKDNQGTITDVFDFLGDKRYELLAFDLVNQNWQNAVKIKDLLLADNKPVLLCIPGFLSTVDKGFGRFLSDQGVNNHLQTKFNRYVLGCNMPSLLQGIVRNSDWLLAELNNLGLTNRDCTVIARSRGGLVARYLYEFLLNNNPPGASPVIINKMVFTGVPHQGTRMVENENWQVLINLITNILGVASLSPAVFGLIKAIINGIVNLPGMSDQKEGSELITKLNSLNINRQGYFCLTSDYEPDRLLKKLADQWLIDRFIFKGEKNDLINPLAGAVFKNSRYPVSFMLGNDQFYTCQKREGVSHFKYLDPQNKHLVERVLDWIK